MGDKIRITDIFTVDGLEATLKRVPNDIESNIILAEKYIQMKNYSQAIRPLKTLIPLMRDIILDAVKSKRRTISINAMLLPSSYSFEDFETMYRFQLEAVAICYMELGDYEKALKYQETNLKISDSDLKSWNLYGVLLSRVGNHDSAEQAFLSALVIDPQFEHAWINLGREYKVLSRVLDESRITEYLKSHRSIEFAFTLLVELLYLKGDFDLIQKVFRNHMKKKVLTNHSLNTLSNCFIQQGLYDEAEQILEKLISRNPDDDSYKWQLSRVYALQNKQDSCFRILGKIEKNHSQFVQAKALRSALEDEANSTQAVKVFFQYYRGMHDSSLASTNQGLYFRYLTEIHVKIGTTVGDLVHILVRGEIERISPYIGLPSIHYASALSPQGGSVYCESMPCMLQEIHGDNIASFMISYKDGIVPRDRREADLSDLLFNGDVLVLQKSPLRTIPINVTLSSAFLIEPALKMMIDEEKKGQTQFNLRLRNEPSDKIHSDNDKTVTNQNRFIDNLVKEIDLQDL